MSRTYIPALVRFDNGDVLLGIYYYGKSDYLSPWIFSIEEMENKKSEIFNLKDVFEYCKEKDTEYKEEHKNEMKYYPG